MKRAFTRSHEWLQLDETGLTLGLSAFACDEIGEATHVLLPQVGEAVTAGDIIVEIESAKAINEIAAPCAGQITAINTALVDDPTLLNREPETHGWLLRLSGDQLPEGLLSPADYATHISD